MKSIKPRKLLDSETEAFINLTEPDITSDKLKELFAVFYGENTAKFQPNDKFTLKKNKFYNKEEIETTVGRYIYNVFALPVPYLKKHGYCNLALDGKAIGGIQDKMGEMILADEMTTKEYASWMDHTEWLAMNTAYYTTASLGKNIITPIPEVIKKRDELFNQYKDEINSGNNDAVNKIEKELSGMAKEKLDAMDDPCYDNYKNGVFAFDVAYKKGMIMIGAIEDPSTGKINVLKSNFTDGVSPDEYDKVASITVDGGYGRGVKTRTYGYETKKYNASLQNEILDSSDDISDVGDDGGDEFLDAQDDAMNDEVSTITDCGTTKCLDITIPKELKSMFLYRFVLDTDGKLVELTKENIDKYIEKPVKLRSPMFCKGEHICEHCAGTLFKKMKLKNIGLVASNMTGNLMNMSLKKMHDSTVKISHLNIEEYIVDK